MSLRLRPYYSLHSSSLCKRGANHFDTVEFSILPHSLRAKLRVPPDEEISLAARADFSNLSEWVPAIYVDVKIPSEHYLKGKQYAAEMQITHAWKKKDSFINVSILLDSTHDKPNPRVEEFVREWEETYYKTKHDCRQKYNTIKEDYQRTYPRRTPFEMAQIWDHPDDVPGKADWDVYGFLPTPWYCGYRGTLTVPPCKVDVIWRVADWPLTVSVEQVERMRKVLLNPIVEEDCSEGRNEVAFEGGVNRPVQVQNDKRLWCCTRENWKPKYRWIYERFDDEYESWRPKRETPPITY